jgi:BirA family biotin operon repressor/biotin-[acetyl-CoA-carboxylase] ligase
VILTDHQLQGRGRQGATWSDAIGTALLFSVVLQREATSPLLPLLAGVCVASAIESLTALKLELKWPNDVLLEHLKLAGILAEASAGEVILGIGVNVNTPQAELPEGATSIAAATGRRTSRERLLAAILKQLEQNLEKGRQLGDRWIVDRWKSRAAMLGESVEVIAGGKQQQGIAEDVDERGRLWIRMTDGTRTGLVAGEVRRIRRVP